MASISNGTIKTTNGHNKIFGVYEASGPFQGPFPIGSTVSGSFGFRGDVCFYDGGTGSLHFTATGTAQPVLNERITTSGAASGTITQFDNEPDLSGAHVGDWLYVLSQGGATHYMVGAIPTRSQLEITTTYAGTSNPEEEYAIGRSYTPVYGIPFPERGDKGASEIVKRGAFRTEEVLASGVGISSFSVANSLTISGVPVATADDVEDMRTEAMAVLFPTITGGNITLLEYSPYQLRIDSVVGITRTGTVSGTFKINGAIVSGLANAAFNTSQSTKTATAANTIGVGQRFTVAISGVSNAADVAMTIIGRRL